MRVHTFGDSHCEYGWKNIKMPNVDIITHQWNGPSTAAGFGIGKLNFKETF